MTPIEHEGAGPVQMQPVGRPPGRFVAAGLVAFLVFAIGLGRWLDSDARPDSNRAFADESEAVASPSPPPTVVPTISTPPAWGDTTISRADPDGTGLVAVRPGRFDIPWLDIGIGITLPGGWSSSRSGTVVCIAEDGACGPSLSFHAVTAVAPPAEVCGGTLGHLVQVPGPTVEDLTAALASLLGPDRPGPTDLAMGGFPAKRFDLTGLVDHCAGGPDGRIILGDANGSPFGVLIGGTGIVYVADVDGRPLAIATQHRGASAEEVKQLDRVVASIEIESMVASVEHWPGHAEDRWHLVLVLSRWHMGAKGRDLAQQVLPRAAGCRGDHLLGRCRRRPMGHPVHHPAGGRTFDDRPRGGRGDSARDRTDQWPIGCRAGVVARP